jgi:hypothetical protein
MQNFITTILLGFILIPCFGQKKCNSSLYLQGEYNRTLSDITIGNNPWGMGLGLQLFFRQTSKLRPAIELTADAYLEDDKVYRLYSDGRDIPTVREMINLFGGASFHPNRIVYLSFVAGPSFIRQIYLGIKPSLGFYLSSNQKVTAKVSYINVFHRAPREKEKFSSVSLSLGFALF